MTQLFCRLCAAVLCVVSLATGSQYCDNSLDCDTYALCRNHYCDCMTGWKNNYRNGKLYCTDDSSRFTATAIFIPLVFFVLVVAVVAIIIYCILKKRRVARPVLHQTAWVQPAQATIGIPVAAQSYPSMYPTQQYQQVQPPPYTQQAPMPAYNQQGYNTIHQINPTNTPNQDNPMNK